ncbi:unnamed protein product [Brachionus calyciflorus]|uniref:Choline/carnitine acyltransferase domain-containing protein n=1 Tax=Brachionus calyciflorus TaxID=104777 RepID=A0A813M6R5_9BILA|nr:unnamed protein product [Brachionus calyciflorus]
MSQIDNKETNSLKNQTFYFDNQLPSLPVPNLDKTLKKYLDSVQPFLTEIEFLETCKKIENFRNGIGKHLHFKLLERARHERNWLEKWWLDWAYLEWREPLSPFINTSGCVVGSELPNEILLKAKQMNINVQAAQVAFCSYFMNVFFEELRNETFPVQKSRSTYFSMDQFRKFYNTCRIPLENKDELHNHFKTVKEGECPTHLIVMYRNRFFKVDIYDKDSRLLTITELYHQFKSIFDNYNLKPLGVGIGALTADKRDDWARNRQHLINLSPKNLSSLENIEKSLYLINFEELDAQNIDEIINVSLLQNPKNRYFDKSYELIVTKSGMIGSNVEHTPFDGMVSTTVIAYTLEKTKKLGKDLISIESFGNRGRLIEPEELEFIYDEKIQKEILKSASLFENTCALLECKNLILANCSREKLKSYRVNPDTFTQMCMQLAYYQLHKKPAPTYETATTRAYYHGRTETVRSCTNEAIEFCKQMCNDDKSTRLNDFELLKLFKKACEKHDTLMNEARDNQGCDRHLLGLMLISKELKLELPEIYTDPAWKKSGGGGNFLISSSCVGYNNVVGTCCPFGLNGYTMIYCFSNQGLCFSLTRFKNSTETNMESMINSLKSATLKVQHLFEMSPKI